MTIIRMRTFASLAILTTAVFLAATVPVHANGPLANCQSGQPFLWPGGGANIPFNPDQGSLGPLTNAGAVAAVQSAFDVWGAVPSSTVSYTNAGPLPIDVDHTNFGPYLNAPAPDGLSAIVFDHTGQIFNLLFGPGSGVLGFAGPEWGLNATCEILEGRAFLNGPAFTNATAALDVMVHEFGHYTNLAHTAVNGQIFLAGDASGPSPNNTFGPPASITQIETLYPFYFGPGSGTASLAADDIAGVSTLYPDAGFASGTGSIRGTIFASNGTTRLNGVNVIARNVANPFNDAVSALSGDFTDSSSQLDPIVGTFRLNNLTPGAQYAVYVDQILAGGFSTPPILLPAAEEFHSGAAESNNITTPDPAATFSAVTVAAGVPNTGIDVIFNAIAPGDPIPLGDDDFEEVSLPFTFSYCGIDYTSIFINSNGSLTFESGDTDFTESVAEHLNDQPRIAALWDDLAPNAGGTVVYNQTASEFVVSFTNVPVFPNVGANSFDITLQRSSNHIDIAYGSLTAAGGLAGLSCGGRVTTRFETEVDLTALLALEGAINPRSATAVFEIFTASDNDLDGLLLPYSAPNAFKDTGESNDTFGKATRVNLPYSSINRFTAIEPAGGDVDFFRIRLEAGNTFLAETIAGRSDTLIGLFNAAGTLVAADDDNGAGLLSKLSYPVTAGGDYFLAVTTFPDLDFTGDGGAPGGRYVLTMSSFVGFLVTLGDDDFEQVTLPFSFPFQGTSYTSVFVNSNGNLTFGSGDTDLSESVAEFLNDQPRIAALWDDLNPGAAGTVIASQTAGTWTVEFQGVPEFLSTVGNTFSVTLTSTGGIELTYGDTANNDGLVGITPGGGAANPGQTDLSAAGTLPATGTTYQLFGNAQFDLDFLTLMFLP
ncbi:MAG: hypothetical protein ACREAA_16685 [Candidatus Polarisedimenticolia bacterium]